MGKLTESTIGISEEKIVNQEIVSQFILRNSSDGVQLVEVYFCLSIAYRRDPE